MQFPLYRPFLSGKEREYVNQCFDSTWISSKGKFIEQFELSFAEYIGVERAVSVSNGTVALHLALMALHVGAGDEVIVPTLTYVASVNAIMQAGAVPVFVDSCPDTWQMDPAAIQAAITERTRAVMAVHLYGGSCDLTALVAICKVRNLHLIEDCAEGFGAYWNGHHVGTYGDVSTFSFFGNKTITTGEGGMLVTNSHAIADKAYHLKTQAVSPDREYWHDMVGYNYRMTNICAAIGAAQLESATHILARKRQIAEAYDAGLHDLPVEAQAAPAVAIHARWLYSILVAAEHRDPLRRWLRDLGVETRPVFSAVHRFPHLVRDLSFPVAEDLARRGISLPSYPDLSSADVETICAHIRGFFYGIASEASAGGGAA